VSRGNRAPDVRDPALDPVADLAADPIVDPAIDSGSGRRPGPGAEPGPVDALRQRWQAETDRWATVARIALTETRLAGGSALVLIGLAAAATVLVMVCWLLLMALLTLGLVTLGLGAAAALATVLVAHLLAIAVIAVVARRCIADLRFDHTRRALGRTDAPLPAKDR